MDSRLQFNPEQLEKLLQLWKDCPENHRSILSPGIKQLLELSRNPYTVDRYTSVRYPHMFFQLVCDASILALERGESINDGTQSTLITAWNTTQLSIHLIDTPGRFTKLLPRLATALREMGTIIDDFETYEKEDGTQERKLKMQIQRLACSGALATLQMLGHIISKEKLDSKKQDLDR